MEMPLESVPQKEVEHLPYTANTLPRCTRCVGGGNGDRRRGRQKKRRMKDVKGCVSGML